MRWRAIVRAWPAVRTLLTQTQGKDWYRSKTIWTNVVLAAAGLATAATGIQLDLTPGEAAALVNLALRLATHEPVRLRRPAEGASDAGRVSASVSRPAPTDHADHTRSAIDWTWLDPGD